MGVIRLKKTKRIQRGGKKMESAIKLSNFNKTSVQTTKKESPWEELSDWCADLARDTNLTWDEAIMVLEKVREEDASCS